MVPSADIRAWRPVIPGVVEVLHATFTDHSYPLHTHDAWTLLIIDAGAVTYELDRHTHGAVGDRVTILPPHVPHDGRAATPHGFRKRVLYLDEQVLGSGALGVAVDRPDIPDLRLRHRIATLHDVLAGGDEELEAESRLAFVREGLLTHLRDRVVPAREDPMLARRLRELLDARLLDGITLEEAGTLLQRHPTHLVRAFTRAHGLPPHRYVTGRRIDRARRLLLAGMPAAQVAAATGFHDQSHLTRHFVRMLGTTPGRYARRAS